MERNVGVSALSDVLNAAQGLAVEPWISALRDFLLMTEFILSICMKYMIMLEQVIFSFACARSDNRLE